MQSINNRIRDVFIRIRELKPLIHHITNLVVMNDTANVTLHIGALPVMAHAVEEVAEMVGMAGALVLNSGTLCPNWIEGMLVAGRKANKRSIPIVLDPVGAGATMFRTWVNRRFLDELSIQVVRGNPGEIGTLSGLGGTVRGVESVKAADNPVIVARRMAHSYDTIVAITGQNDIVSDGERVLSVENGHPWLTTLTGTGCMATTFIAAFAAVEQDYLIATAGALATYGLAAEMAAEHARGPASFKVALFDQIYNLTPDHITKGLRIREM